MSLLDLYKRSILAVLCCALLAQICIAQGYMPSRNDQGTFEIVICTIYGVETRVVDADFNVVEDHEPPEHEKASECAYALSSIYAVSNSVDNALPSRVAYYYGSFLFESVFIPLRSIIRAWYPTGPPALF